MISVYCKHLSYVDTEVHMKLLDMHLLYKNFAM